MQSCLLKTIDEENVDAKDEVDVGVNIGIDVYNTEDEHKSSCNADSNIDVNIIKHRCKIDMWYR